MTLFFYIIIGMITFVAFLHAWSKKGYDLSRTIIINKPKTEVYAYIRQLKKQSNWMPWYKKDRNLNIKFKEEDGKVGAAAYWKGSGSLAEGVQRIIKIKDGKVFESQLLFLKPYKFHTLQYIAVKEIEPEKTKLVWGIRGVHQFPASVIMQLYGMEKALGNDFEQGLQNLKENLENRKN